MRRPAVLYGSLAIVAVGLVVACGDDPSPVKPSPLAPSPFAAIQVMGPDSIAPGQSAQFVGSIRQADDTTKSATSMPNLRWFSSNPSVAGVSSTGVVTASPSAFGEVVITAALQTGVGGTRAVVVQPEGTYRMVGSVREADAPTKPVVGARVEVLPGPNFTLTDSIGQYRLYGVPAESTIRIIKSGYETIDQPLGLSANVTRNFTLALNNGPRLVLNGPYTISVDSVSPCSLNSAMQHRTYEAVLTTAGNVVDVVLTEPRFRLDSSGSGNHFWGSLLAGGATFILDSYSDGSYWYEYQYPSLVERLADNTHLVVEGVATTTGSAAGLTGTLSGYISNLDSRFPTVAGYLGYCSGSIQFRVTPR